MASARGSFSTACATVSVGARARRPRVRGRGGCTSARTASDVRGRRARDFDGTGEASEGERRSRTWRDWTDDWRLGWIFCVTVYRYGVLCFHEPTRRGSAARGETGSEGER